jgi:hypothetical protein
MTDHQPRTDLVQYNDDGSPTTETIKRAMKAFRKRIKLMRLDEESQIGKDPLSHGQKSTICGIRPPEQYPVELWDKLAKLGRLRKDHRGLYEIVEM